MTDSEPVSLDFIEDPYLPKLDNVVTPSLDEIPEHDQRLVPIKHLQRQQEFSHVLDVAAEEGCNDGDGLYWCDETESYLRNLTLDQIFYDVDSDYMNTLELQTVETEFVAAKLATQPPLSIAKRFRLKFFTRQSMREVKVTFIDFSKPYLARISSSDNYKKFLNFGSSSTTAAGVSGMNVW